MASERAPDPLRTATRGAGHGRPLVVLTALARSVGPRPGREWHSLARPATLALHLPGGVMKPLAPRFAACLTVALLLAQSRPAAVQAAEATPAVTAGPLATARTPRDYVAEARASFTPENREYQRIRVGLNLLSPLVGVAAGLLLLFTGLAQRFRDLARARAQGRWGRVLVFFSLYSLAMFVLLLPLAWYDDFALEHRFGFSHQTFAAWGADQLKAL